MDSRKLQWLNIRNELKEKLLLLLLLRNVIVVVVLHKSCETFGNRREATFQQWSF